jgi:hypothetical protein
LPENSTLLLVEQVTWTSDKHFIGSFPGTSVAHCTMKYEQPKDGEKKSTIATVTVQHEEQNAIITRLHLKGTLQTKKRETR